jgi:hypothetical protein
MGQGTHAHTMEERDGCEEEYWDPESARRHAKSVHKGETPWHYNPFVDIAKGSSPAAIPEQATRQSTRILTCPHSSCPQQWNS